MSNLPIYRAKKKYSDEYVDGCLNIWEQNGKIYHSIIEIGKYPSPFNNIHIIEDSTLSIHFPDMLDSQGNKIFASLQEDGRGGDIVDLPNYLKTETCTAREATIVIKPLNRCKAFCNNGDTYGNSHFIGKSKIIGIKK